MQEISTRDIWKVIAEFEASHDVSAFVFNGINLWPVIRCRVGWEIANIDGFTGRSRRAKLSRAGSAWVKTVRSKFLSGKSATTQCPHDGDVEIEPADAIGFSNGYRTHALGKDTCFTVVQPILEELQRRGMSTAIWDFGTTDRALEQYAWVYPVTSDAGRQVNSRVSNEREPPWFAEVSTWFEFLLERELEWRDFVFIGKYMLALRDRFDVLLERAHTKLILLDCWYYWEAMALSAAAKTRGITTVDIQHGIQEYGHHAYTGWGRPADRAYQIVPDYIWLWGEAALKSATSPVAKPTVGGNVWLNAWKAHPSAAMREALRDAEALGLSGKRRILFTLGWPSLQHIEMVRELIQVGSKEWQWLIRVHPSRRHEIGDVEDALEGASPYIEVRRSSEVPLYALLQAVDVHVTFHSTTTEEALSFGVPTVTMGDLGHNLFTELSLAGVVSVASSLSDVLSQIEHTGQIDAQRCRSVAQHYFAEPEETDHSIDTLLQAVEQSRCAIR